jgi:vanillate O-demethylase ferredoxin subunit
MGCLGYEFWLSLKTRIFLTWIKPDFTLWVMETQKLKVTARREVASGIVEWTLADPNAKLLPGHQAGAHIDVHIGPQLARAYSLTQPSGGQPTAQYVFAVALASASRGGSAHLHQHVQVGHLL